MSYTLVTTNREGAKVISLRTDQMSVEKNTMKLLNYSQHCTVARTIMSSEFVFD